MKKYLFVILCLFLVSCGKNTNLITDYSGNPIVLEDYEYVGTFENGDDIYIDAYRYYFQDAAWGMILVRDGEVIKLFNSSPSKPKFSKDRNKILYVDELQFEAIGNVTIYDSMTETETYYTDFTYDGQQQTVKDVEWYEDDTILCIVGFGTGTITQGGMVYQLDLSSQELTLILQGEKIEQWTDRPYEVVDVYIAENELDITLVEWSDDNYMEYYYTKHRIRIEETMIK